MNNFEKIVSLTDGPVQYEMTGTGNIKVVQHPYPYSIKQEEFGIYNDTNITQR